jgi:signal transduction histidine kinase
MSRWYAVDCGQMHPTGLWNIQERVDEFGAVLAVEEQWG